MNIAILSDIHSNNPALEACIQMIDEYEIRCGKKIDHVFLLGDFITDGPYPETTMDLIYDLMKRYPSDAVCGNREEYLLSEKQRRKESGVSSWKKCSGSGLLLYTYEHTRDCDWRFYQSLPSHTIVSLDGIEPITIAHGSQYSSRDNYKNDPQKGDLFLQECPTRVLIGGHSHLQQVIEKDGKLYINPGSVGKAENGIGAQAQFAVISYNELTDTSGQDRLEVRFFSIPYNVERFCRQCKESGLSEYSKWLLEMSMSYSRTGINDYVKSVHEVERLSKTKAFDAPEKYWEQACTRILKQYSDNNEKE